MESNHNHEDHSKTSSDEDQTAPDLNNDELAGTGRSYECVFCKRGFTTAQALGGHMNIHRKERAIKTRPTSAPNFTTTTTTTTSTQPVHNNHHSTTLGSYPAIHSTALDDHQLDHVNYTTYIPAPTWVVGHPHALNPSDDHEEEDLCSRNYPRLDHHDQSLFTDNQDWRSGRSLSLGIGPSSQYVDEHHHHHNKQIRVANGGSCTQLGDAHELDLELRLGHDP